MARVALRDHRIELAVAQPPKKPRKPLDPHAGVGDSGDRSAPRSVNGSSAEVQRTIRKYVARDVVVLEAAGSLDDVVKDLDQAIMLALADSPRGVVCDLSAVLEDDELAAVELLADAGRHVRDWPGVPVAVVSPDRQVRAAVAAHPLGEHLIVNESILGALSAVLRTPTPVVESMHLAPHPTAPRASRDFVTRTLLDWGLSAAISSASLVVSELVTNSTLYAGTKIDLSLALDRRALRLTVRDHGPGIPLRRQAGLGQHGRGLTIVAVLSRAFGFLPTADGGKVVWAVLEVPMPSPLTDQGSSDWAEPIQVMPLPLIPRLQEEPL